MTEQPSRVEARLELRSLAHLVARGCRGVDVEAALRILVPDAFDTLPPRELEAIVALAKRPLG